MKNTPLDSKIVNQLIKKSGLDNVGNSSIRELVRLVNSIESATGEKFVRMEMGVPGLEPDKIGIEAEIEALNKGVASKYPMIEGVPELKKQASRFAELFLDIKIDAGHVLPTVGSMQGGCASFLITGRCYQHKNRTLFIDPGFPVQKQQHVVLGLPYESFDVYDYRGNKLEAKLRSYLEKGDVSSIIYSNPNNPSWICFTEKELQIIGKLANEYDVIVIEDLAYFAMDFRSDMSVPGKPPYQPTVAKYTDNYMLLVSSSKAFSYAGQRLGLLYVSDTLFPRQFPYLKQHFPSTIFGKALTYGAVYALSAGTGHSAQYGFAAMLRAANNGQFNFLEHVREYGERASVMKRLFTENGFKIVYDKDEDKPLADGFYFTFSYPGFTGEELVEELLYYGISAISLGITGSNRKEGLRACVSQTSKSQFPDLEERLKMFHDNHPVK